MSGPIALTRIEQIVTATAVRVVNAVICLSVSKVWDSQPRSSTIFFVLSSSVVCCVSYRPEAIFFAADLVAEINEMLRITVYIQYLYSIIQYPEYIFEVYVYQVYCIKQIRSYLGE